MNIFGRMVERAKSEGQSLRSDTSTLEDDIDVAAMLAPLPSKSADQMRAQTRRTQMSELQSDTRREIRSEPKTTDSAPSKTTAPVTTATKTSSLLNRPTSSAADRETVANAARKFQDLLAQETGLQETRQKEAGISKALTSDRVKKERIQDRTQERVVVKDDGSFSNSEHPKSNTPKKTKPDLPAVKSGETVTERAEAKSDLTMAYDYVETIRQYSRRTVEQQERAESRLRGLTGVLKQVEMKLATYARMESRLDAALSANQVLQGDIDKGKERSQMLELRIKTLEPQYVALRDTLETARIDLSTQRDVIREQKEKLARFNTLLSKAATRVAETNARSASVVQSYKKLRSEFQEQTRDLANKDRRLVDLEKGWDAMAKKLAVRNNDYEIMAVELKGLKNEHEDLKRRYLDASAAFENARYEFKSQITMLRNKLLRRNEEYTTLQSHLESFKTQVEETGGLTAFREREIVELKDMVEAERERVREAESRLVDKAHLADMNGRALERAKFEYEMLNEKYATALSDIDMFKNMALSQNQKLSRYAAVSGSIDTEETKSPTSKLAALQSQKAQKSEENPSTDSDNKGSFDPGFKTRAFVTPSHTRS